MVTDNRVSIAFGGPLEDEPGMGPLTIPGYLHEVVRRNGPAEAVVMWDGDHRIAWSYDDLLARAQDVAKALIAAGLGREERVGILMTNRPEFLASLFGTSLAGGVPVALSTFSTAPELDHLIRASQVSILLFESRVLKTDFRAMIAAHSNRPLTKPVRWPRRIFPTSRASSRWAAERAGQLAIGKPF